MKISYRDLWVSAINTTTPFKLMIFEYEKTYIGGAYGNYYRLVRGLRAEKVGALCRIGSDDDQSNETDSLLEKSV